MAANQGQQDILQTGVRHRVGLFKGLSGNGHKTYQDNSQFAEFDGVDDPDLPGAAGEVVSVEGGRDGQVIRLADGADPETTVGI